MKPGRYHLGLSCRKTPEMQNPKITDNDAGEITATIDGKEIRGWSYKTRGEQREKMQMAHEFAEGWFMAREAFAKLAEDHSENNSNGDLPYDGGSGAMGYSLACREVSEAIRNCQ